MSEEIKDTYTSVARQAEGLFKDRGSRFISMAFPVETEDEIKAIQESLRKEYHDARHHCFAYRLGVDGEKFRSSDDGEPSGSSGKPILGQLLSRDLSDTLVVVVRYFGGIKLGIPGLIRAYRTAASEALDNAGTVQKTAKKRFKVSFGYMAMNPVMKLLKEQDLPQTNQDFGVSCSLETAVRLSEVEDFLLRINNIEDCRADMI